MVKKLLYGTKIVPRSQTLKTICRVGLSRDSRRATADSILRGWVLD
jgi:hypothetical protein